MSLKLITEDGPAPIYLTYAEVAKRWRCSKATIARRVRAGELETTFNGALLRVTMASVLDYEAKQRRAS